MTDDERELLIACAYIARQKIADNINIASQADPMSDAIASMSSAFAAERKERSEKIAKAEKALARLDALIDRVMP